MIESDERPIKFRGQPATLTVMRNNGVCWGRVRVGTKQFDVVTRADHYDDDNADALDAFERASRHPRCIEKAQGWL